MRRALQCVQKDAARQLARPDEREALRELASGNVAVRASHQNGHVHSRGIHSLAHGVLVLHTTWCRV